MRRLSHKEVQWLVQGHTTGKYQSLIQTVWLQKSCFLQHVIILAKSHAKVGSQGAGITEVDLHTKLELHLAPESQNDLFLEAKLHYSLGAGVLLTALEMFEAPRSSQGSCEQEQLLL